MKGKGKEKFINEVSFFFLSELFPPQMFWSDFQKKKKKPRVADFLLDIKGRSGDRQLSVTAALPGSGEVVRV